MRKGILAAALALTMIMAAPRPAFALDKRIAGPAMVLAKTSGVGAGAGIALGLAAKALFDSSWRTAFKFSSIGLYGGLAFGIFILAAPPETFWGEPEGAGDRDDGRRRDDGYGGLLRSRHGPDTLAGGPPVGVWTPVYSGRF